MRKNVAGQSIGAEINSRSDGTPLTTGTVTVYVTGDNGAQAAGSVGAGACTHKGRGYWSYVPDQAETNYDHVAFTFEHSGGINATVQVFTSFPQTGDSFARLGAPAGASIAADIAVIESQADDIGVAGAGLTNIPWNPAWDVEVESEVTDALNVYNGPTHAELISEINDVQADIAALSTGVGNVPTAEENADMLLGRHIAGGSSVSGVEARNVRNALRALRNRQAIIVGVGTVYEEDDTTVSWTYAATTTAGNPLSEINPT